jgi:translation elongation factor EF-G
MIHLKKNNEEVENIYKSICKADHDGPLVVFVCKMQPYDSKMYDASIRSASRSDETQRLIAIARVFSGVIYQGQKVLVMNATHTNEKPDYKETTIEHLFLLMGSSLSLLTQAGPGCIIGIGGMDNLLMKTGTISTTLACPNFSRFEGISTGLVKVSIEPELTSMIDYLRQGLEKLVRADPALEFYTTKKGEDILSTCGEVHLQKCLKDLEVDFAPGCKFTTGEPMIPFKETTSNRRLKAYTEKKKKKMAGDSGESSEDSDGMTFEEFV